MTVKFREKEIRPDFAFALYFTLMFCFYTKTYIQLAVQLLFIAYVLVKPFRESRYRILKVNLFYFYWFGVFTLVVLLSRFWAVSSYAKSNTALTVFRIFVMGAMIAVSAKSEGKLISILLSFIIGFFVICSAALFVGVFVEHNIGEVTFGSSVGHHRNAFGAVAVPLIFLCYYLRRYYHMRYGFMLSAFFTFVTLCTGSNASFVQIIIIFSLCLLIGEQKLSRRVTNILILVLVGAFGIILLQVVPFFQITFFARLQKIIESYLGPKVLDSSTNTRNLLRNIAFRLFLNRPWIGYGVDGVYCFLLNNPLALGASYSAVYAHCNYAEIAADFGILGLAVWYVPLIILLVKLYRIRKMEQWTTCLVSIFISVLVLDYARIMWYSHLQTYLFVIIVLLCIHNLKYAKEQEGKKEIENH